MGLLVRSAFLWQRLRALANEAICSLPLFFCFSRVALGALLLFFVVMSVLKRFYYYLLLLEPTHLQLLSHAH